MNIIAQNGSIINYGSGCVITVDGKYVLIGSIHTNEALQAIGLYESEERAIEVRKLISESLSYGNPGFLMPQQ